MQKLQKWIDVYSWELNPKMKLAKQEVTSGYMSGHAKRPQYPSKPNEQLSVTTISIIITHKAQQQEVEFWNLEFFC